MQSNGEDHSTATQQDGQSLEDESISKPVVVENAAADVITNGDGTAAAAQTSAEEEEESGESKPQISTGTSLLPASQDSSDEAVSQETIATDAEATIADPEPPVIDAANEAEGVQLGGTDVQTALSQSSGAAEEPATSTDRDGSADVSAKVDIEQPSNASVSEPQTEPSVPTEAPKQPPQPTKAPQATYASVKGSAVFILAALEQLLTSKDAKGSRSAPKQLREAAEAARDLVKNLSASTDSPFDPRIVFEPFRLACDPSKSTTTQTIALDCIGKMVSYGFFASSAEATDGQRLPDVVVNTICQLPPNSPSAITLQQLKALLSLILAGLAQQSALLSAVRTAYDVFLFSKDPQTQAVAQGVLTQMCSATFSKIKPIGDTTAGSSRPGHQRDLSKTTAQGDPIGAVSLKDMEARASFDQSAAGINLEAPNDLNGNANRDAEAAITKDMSEDEIRVKDAFLVIRALCKLSMKPLGPDAERDLRSHGMRSKLLSLHLILGILRGHLHVFSDPSISLSSASTGERTPLVQAVKQYLCLTLSRNAVSPVNQVFDVSCEIFWIVLGGLRNKLKKEIEVLLNEIFLPILEMRTSTNAQKTTLLNIFMRLCRDPPALVEIYLNYDCDRTALDNVYERLITVISKISQTQLSQEVKDKARESHSSDSTASGSVRMSRQSTSSSASGAVSLPPALSTSAIPDFASSDGFSSGDNFGSKPIEMRLKQQSLDCLCAVLRSLVLWSDRGHGSAPEGTFNGQNGPVEDGMTRSTSIGSIAIEVNRPSSPRASEDAGEDGLVEDRVGSAGGAGSSHDISRVDTPDSSNKPNAGTGEDDPLRFQDAKQRKTVLLEGIRKFNFKPKRGIDFLLQNGILRSKEPADIARFLLFADGLNKAQIGEYLGEGEAENIAVMHAFVDLMSFDNMPFTAALRRFLQAFRLPGESQKIDRYMLKFAERYVAANPDAFANADTAYVFSYSVIMLNTDAHNPQVKHRMTLKDFIRNNEGIDDGKSLPEDYIKSVYDEIQTNEIRMKDEQLAAAATPAPSGTGLAGAIATVGRDLQREAYVLQSEGMANKTEALFRTMVRAQRRVRPEQRAAAEQFFSASHFEHVRPMFEVAWMAFLAGIANPLQESDDSDTIAKCLAAFGDAIHIVCLFGMELERNAFVTTLSKFTFLNNLGEMKSKNVEAIKTLLGVALTEGNYLKGSWKDVLLCVSQLERFQLISGGVDERQLPDVGRAASRTNAAASRNGPSLPDEEVVQAGISSEVTIAADMIFSSSAKLSGEAIVDFVQCLAENSWDEIQSSGMIDQPRLFSLQKLVEISYYNMRRIRLEWSSIWAVLGQHFNRVCTHPNTKVAAFALDSLRQLSNRFLELEELPHFKFQKDFLKPFEYTIRNTKSVEAKEMVLSCLHQMILSKIENMRSGWRTIFGTLGACGKSGEKIATHSFELVRGLYTNHFDEIIHAGAFADLTVCLTEFAKASQAQKIALRAVELLSAVVGAMLASPLCPLDPTSDPGPATAQPPVDDPMVRFWFPSLFAFYDVIMTGDDLEVRRIALDSLFEILKQHGTTFRPDFWNTVCQEVIFPIFSVLKSRSDVSRFSSQEDMSVWLSTTMIQALRHLIALWTHYFETLESLLPKLLSLLCACICQENDTLARIGTSCFQQLIENNVRKLSDAQWSEVVGTFIELFEATTAHQLFDPALRAEHVAPASPISEGRPAVANGIDPLSPGRPREGVQTAPMTSSERRRTFKQIIVKCVLQLLLIETAHELLAKPIIYELIPPQELLRLTQVLENSYRFSKMFNADKELRMSLWRVGFMKQLPNLLKQESSSAATLINLLVRLHGDARWSHRSMRAEVRKSLVPLGEEVINSYMPLDPETQSRNVTAWTPVVAEVFNGICTLHDISDDEEVNPDETIDAGAANTVAPTIGGRVFAHHAKIFYPLAVDLLSREPLPASIGDALRTFFYKVGLAKGMIDEHADRERRKKVQEGRDREKGLRSVSMENLPAPSPFKQPVRGPSQLGSSLNLPDMVSPGTAELQT